MQWRIISARNWLAVVSSVRYYSAGVNPFLTGGLWPRVKDIGQKGWRQNLSLNFWGQHSKLGSDSWSNSLIIRIYPYASTWRHFFVSSLQNNICTVFTLVPDIRKSMCDTVQLVQIRFWRIRHGRVVRTLGGGECVWDSKARVRN